MPPVRRLSALHHDSASCPICVAGYSRQFRGRACGRERFAGQVEMQAAIRCGQGVVVCSRSLVADGRHHGDGGSSRRAPADRGKLVRERTSR